MSENPLNIDGKQPYPKFSSSTLWSNVTQSIDSTSSINETSASLMNTPVRNQPPLGPPDPKSEERCDSYLRSLGEMSPSDFAYRGPPAPGDESVSSIDPCTPIHIAKTPGNVTFDSPSMIAKVSDLQTPHSIVSSFGEESWSEIFQGNKTTSPRVSSHNVHKTHYQSSPKTTNPYFMKPSTLNPSSIPEERSTGSTEPRNPAPPLMLEPPLKKLIQTKASNIKKPVRKQPAPPPPPLPPNISATRVADQQYRSLTPEKPKPKQNLYQFEPPPLKKASASPSPPPIPAPPSEEAVLHSMQQAEEDVPQREGTNPLLKAKEKKEDEGFAIMREESDLAKQTDKVQETFNNLQLSPRVNLNLSSSFELETIPPLSPPHLPTVCPVCTSHFQGGNLDGSGFSDRLRYQDRTNSALHQPPESHQRSSLPWSLSPSLASGSPARDIYNNQGRDHSSAESIRRMTNGFGGLTASRAMNLAPTALEDTNQRFFTTSIGRSRATRSPSRGGYPYSSRTVQSPRYDELPGSNRMKLLRERFKNLSARVAATDLRYRTGASGSNTPLQGSPAIPPAAIPPMSARENIQANLSSAELRVRFERLKESVDVSPPPQSARVRNINSIQRELSSQRDTSAYHFATSNVFTPNLHPDTSRSVSMDAARAVIGVGGNPSHAGIFRTRMQNAVTKSSDFPTFNTDPSRERVKDNLPPRRHRSNSPTPSTFIPKLNLNNY